MRNRIGLGLFVSLYLLAGSSIVQSGEVTLQFDFTEDQVAFHAVGGFEKVFLKGGDLPGDTAGTPWLPVKYANVLIPSGAKVTGVSASAEEVLLREGIEVYPAQPPQRRASKPVFVPKSAAAYASASKTPANLAVLTGEQTMHGFSFASVRLNPLRCIPAAKQLYLARRITVTVAYAESRARLAAPTANRAAHQADVLSLVANPGDAGVNAPATLPGKRADTAAQYVIVTRASLSNAFSTLASHRSARFTAKILTVESLTNAYTGTDIQQKIRTAIKDYYQNHGTLYVVLGGDDTIVPDRDTKVSVDSDVESAMPTDLYYSGLDGTWDGNGNGVYGETGDSVDMAWEVVVARIPVRTATQAGDYINKVIAYDTAPPAALSRKIMLGGMEAWSTYTGTARPSDDVTADGHMGFRATAHTSVSDSEMWDRRLYRDGIKPYWQAQTIGIFCDTLTSWDTSTGGDYLENNTNVRKRFNEGWWHLFFSGHGSETAWGLESGEFGTTDATALTNKTLFIYTDACLTGHFDGSPEPCLSETFLRNPSGGALIYIGCSRYGWGEPDESPASNTSDGGPSTVYGYKYYQRLYQSNNVTAGKAFAMHKADMIAQCGSNGSERWIQFGLNLQGDPALLVMPSTNGTPPVLNPIGNKTVCASNALSFAVSATRTEGDAVTNLWATGLPSGSSFSYAGSGNTNGTFTWASPSPAGVYTSKFWAADKDGSVSQTITITVTNPPSGGATGGVAAIKFQGFEGAAGDTWSYTAAAGAGTIAVSSDRCRTGAKSLKLSGSSSVNADPSVEFANVNLAGYSSVQLSIAFSASGPDTDDDLYLALSYDNGATWTGAGSVKLVDGYGSCNLAFGGTSAANPATVAANPWVVNIPGGTSQIKVRVRFDEKTGAGNTADHYYIDDLHLTGVSGSSTETPPVLNPIGNKSICASNALSFAVTATRTDGDAVTNVWATGLPSGSSFSYTGSGATNGTFTWASPSPAGAYAVTFWAADNDGADFEAISITVTNPPGGGQTGGVTAIKFQGFESTAADTWSYTTTPGAGTLVISSDRCRTGTKSLKFAGSSAGAADPKVEFANVSLAGYSGVQLSIAFSASGPDASDDLYLDLSFDNGATWVGAGSVKLVDGYSGANIAFGATSAANPTTAAANPWVVNIPAGTAQIKVRVRFDEKATASNLSDYYYIDDIQLTGSSGTPAQSPPVLNPIGNKSVAASNALSFTVTAAPTDGDAVTNMWAAGLPSGSSFSYSGSGATNGTFNWASPSPAGVYAVTFWAADNDGSDSEPISITVTNTGSGSTGGVSTLKFQGFEGAAGDTWAYTATPGAGAITTRTERFSTGAKSLRLGGSSAGSADPYVIFANVSLSGVNNVKLAIAFSASGPDTDDDLWLDLSYDNGATWTGAGSVKLVDGYSSCNIPFGGTSAANPATVGTNPWIVSIPAGTAQIKVRVRFDEKSGGANASDYYYIDDIKLYTGGASKREPQAGESVWINEFDYDNPGTDSNEWVEMVGEAGTSLADYELLYLRANGGVYRSNDLADAGFTFSDEGDGFGFFVVGHLLPGHGVADYMPPNWTNDVFLNTSVSNSLLLRKKTGSLKVHLVDFGGDNTNTVEDQLTMLTDSSSARSSLYLTGGPGSDFAAFSWTNNTGWYTPGSINSGQTLQASATPSVVITNPASASLIVNNDITEWSVAGTCNSNAGGHVAWNNAGSGESGSAAIANGAWSFTTALAEGPNDITVTATNDTGDSASDLTTLTRRAADAAILEDDFEDGDLAGWTSVNAGDWANSDSAPIAGERSMKHNVSSAVGTNYSFVYANPIYDVTANDTAWRFTLKNGYGDPSAVNRFWVYLMANDSDLAGSIVDGYAVGINFSGASDTVTLWRVTNGTNAPVALIKSSFDWNSDSIAGIEVTRTMAGQWELKVDSNGGFDNLLSAGKMTDATYAGSMYFGLVFQYTSTRAGTLWWDDLVILQGALPADLPEIAITDPAQADVTVPYTTTEAALSGQCNANAVGELAWQNGLTGLSGAIPAAGSWSIPAVALNVGTNEITVTATNAAGASAQDLVRIVRLPEYSGGDPADTILFQGFEGEAGDTWNYVMEPGAATVEVSANRSRTGVNSIKLSGSASNADPCVLFDNVDIASYDNIQLFVAYSASGPDSTDDLYLDLSYDGGATWEPGNSIRLVQGNRNLNLVFDATSGNTAGANPYTVDIPEGRTQVRARVRFDEGGSDNQGDSYYVDDIRLTGDLRVGTDDDADGIDDNWECSFFQTISAPDSNPNANPDGDALLNWEEFVLDRNPTNTLAPDAAFEIEGFRIDGGYAIRFPASTRRNYTVQATTTLADKSSWSDLPAQTDVRGTSATMSLDDQTAIGQRYYRIVVEVP